MKIALEKDTNRVCYIGDNDAVIEGMESVILDDVPAEVVQGDCYEWVYADGEFVFDEEFAMQRRDAMKNEKMQFTGSVESKLSDIENALRILLGGDTE